MAFTAPLASALAQMDIWVPSEERWIGAEEMVKRLEGKAVVFLGEVHNDQRHHDAQLIFLRSFLSQYGPFNMALEALPHWTQEKVDLFLKGDLTEREFLEVVECDRVWGFPYFMYRPLVDLVSSSGGNLIAMGVELSEVRGVLEKMEGEGLRTAPPLDALFGPKPYTEELKKFYDSVPVHKGTGDFKNFLRAQALRDEFMARNLLKGFKRYPKRTVALMGNGHLINYWGVPARFLSHLGLPVGTIVMYSREQIELKRPYQNEFVWVID